MAVIELNKDNFNEIINTDKKILIDFFATWCGPCRMVAPVLEEIAEENENIKVVKIDVDQEPGLAQKFGVTSIPLLVVIKDGEVVNQSLGAKPKDQILSMIP